MSAASYYAATANAHPAPSPLEGELAVDVVVIGGGFTGLHAALEARAKGFSVALLEAQSVGWGASGRNGGQMIPGWRKGVTELAARYGEDEARRLFALSLEARTMTLDLIARHDIACDLTATGHLYLAAKPNLLRHFEAEARMLARFGYDRATIIGREAARNAVASPLYHGALLDAGGGHLHPLNFALGLAAAARKAGVVVHEQSRVTRVRQDRVGVTATTAQGQVRARFAVIACDAHLSGLFPPIAARIMPVGAYIIATEKLTNPEALIRERRAVSDSRFVVNYFRLSADGRLLFGGGERYSLAPPADIAAFVRPYSLAVFPQLSGVAIEHAWGGLVSITRSRLPDIGRIGAIFYAHGYSGQGVLLSALAGRVLAEAMAGTAARFDVLAALQAPRFPGGPLMRTPLYVAAMAIYALRDRL